MNDSHRPLLLPTQKPSLNLNDGPPDLDEMWRDFNRRLAGLFGRKGNGSGSGGRKPRSGNNGNGSSQGSLIGTGILIGALIAAWAGSGIFVVRDGQRGVILRLGQYWQTVEPGVHWNPPWPFGAHSVVEVGQHTVEVDSGANVPASNAAGASVITHDGDVFTVRISVQYQVKQPADYLFRSAHPDEAVIQAAQAAMRAVIGAHSTSDLLAQGQASAQNQPAAPGATATPSQSSSRTQIGTQIASAIQHSLNVNQTGLAVTSVTIQRVQPPAAVLAGAPASPNVPGAPDAQASSAPAATNAQTDAQMIADANAYSARVIAQAQADAQRFTLMDEQYAKAPDEVRERIYSETMQQIYANTTKVFIDSPSTRVELPIDKIVDVTRQHAVSPASGMSGSSGPSATAPEAGSANAASVSGSVANTSLRSRDALRSRTRETDLP